MRGEGGHRHTKSDQPKRTNTNIYRARGLGGFWGSPTTTSRHSSSTLRRRTLRRGTSAYEARGFVFLFFRVLQFANSKYAHEYALMGFPSVLKSCRAVEEVRVISIGSGLPTFHIKCYLLACCCRRRALIPKASRSRYMDALHFCSRICRRQQRMPLLHPHT